MDAVSGGTVTFMFVVLFVVVELLFVVGVGVAVAGLLVYKRYPPPPKAIMSITTAMSAPEPLSAGGVFGVFIIVDMLISRQQKRPITTGAL